MSVAIEKIKECEKIFKTLGWKKAANIFAFELNDETISFFSIFEKTPNLIRVQYQTVNKRMNSVRWKIFNIEDQVGSLKDHINNHASCYLVNSLFGYEVDANEPAVNIVTNVNNEALSKSEKFSSVEKIQNTLYEDYNKMGNRLDEQQLCIFILAKKFNEAHELINKSKNKIPMFEMSFFRHAELFLLKN